eukprot:TRINITY_DN3306_c0_g2_i1.p1 TRINITY_DN3306_c0_g2~~TRINITY_DN3306_c0_g2_i1.p1  ORF type:complete len:712 (+),score=55.39 TRINITY_DN3306_c0_g2_i1:57-2192(+)
MASRRDSCSFLEVELASCNSPAPPAQPFRPAWSYVSESCSRGLVLVAVISLMFTGFVLSLAETDPNVKEYFRVCLDPSRPSTCQNMHPWKPLAVGNIVVLSVAAMGQGFRADFVLLLATLVVGILGIITPEQAFSGFSSGGNLAVQGMLIIIRGIQEAGVLDRIFSVLLGAPSSRSLALLRSQTLACTLSAFVSSVSVSVAGAPALMTWAPLIGMASWEVQMPFAFACNMGQSLMMISSPVSLVVDDKMAKAGVHLSTMEPALGCVILSVITIAYGLIFSERLLKPRADSVARVLVEDGKKGFPSGNQYVVELDVSSESLLLGRSLSNAGLLSLPGVDFLGTMEERSEPLVAGKLLRFAVTARGLPRLRMQGHGIILRGHDGNACGAALGGRRHQRLLFEATVGPGSTVLQHGLAIALPRATCVAVRRPRGNMLHRVDFELGQLSNDGSASVSEAKPFVGPLKEGDILLIEAFADFPNSAVAQEDFALIAAVPGSEPPRHGRNLDTRRGWLAGLLLACVLVLGFFKVADIAFLALFAGAFCVILNVVHRDQVMGILNLPLYLMIAGGVGLGEGIYRSGLASGLAKVLVHFGLKATPGADEGIYFAVTLITSGLSNLMSSTATAALVCPIALQICKDQNLSPNAMAMIVLFSANACTMTPFCCAPNTICQPFGPYAFSDYTRFGTPLQVIYLITIPLTCAFVYGSNGNVLSS